jgi:hypothetical protein
MGQEENWMRLWSLDPGYLDARGLVTVWREGLLAKKVLQGRTRGYLHHPQLVRFRAQPDPLAAIDSYLSVILKEATRRGYHFDNTKIEGNLMYVHIPVTHGQLEFEFSHLLNKLKTRNPEKFEEIRTITDIRPHPLFQTIPGEPENWEKGLQTGPG